MKAEPKFDATGTPQIATEVVWGFRWVICGIIFIATTINYIDRQILSLLKEFLDKEIGWTNTQFGIANACFQLAYGLSFLWFGWFIDKCGVKIGYTVSIVSWSVVAIAHAFCKIPLHFYLARAFLGAAEAGNFPAAIKAVAMWFPKRERAFATSIFNAGTNVGALVAPLVVPWLAINLGWQSAFLIAGIAGFMWLALWLPFYTSPEKSRFVKKEELDHILSDKAESQQTSEKVPWLSLLSYPQTWSFVVAKFLTDPVWWFFLIWLPDYFKKTRGLEIKKSWIHIFTIYLIVTVLSIFGGWITGHLAKKGWSITRARKTGMFIFALCVLPVLVVTKQWVSDWAAVVIIGIAGAAHQAWSANLFTTVSDMFPKKAVASVVGLGGFAGAAGGFIFPIVTGRLVDYYEGQGNPTLAYAILFGYCASAYLVAFLLNHLLAPKYEPVKLEAEPPREG